MNKAIEITRSNYKNLELKEGTKYQYRGLILECDHEYDAGIFMIWLNLPSGPNYSFNSNGNGDLPYRHQYMAGYMEGKNSGADFVSALEELMDYVDKYYEYIKPYIND